MRIHWYDFPKDYISYFELDFKNLKLFIGSKPDKIGITRSFAQKIDTWVSLSDQFIDEVPDWNPRMFWHPLTDGKWKIESFFWFKKIMDRELEEKKSKKIYIHCGQGIIRSPLMVYHWLLSHISEKEASILFLNEKNIDASKNLIFFENLGKCPTRETLNSLYDLMKKEKKLGLNDVYL